MMREQMQQRLEELRREFETGQHALAELETKREALSQTMLRIGGAIQVLNELLAASDVDRSLSTPLPRTHDGAAVANMRRMAAG